MLSSLHCRRGFKYRDITKRSTHGFEHNTSFAEPPAAAAAAAALAVAVSALAQAYVSQPVAVVHAAAAHALTETAELAVAFGQRRGLVEGLKGTVEIQWTAVHHVTQALSQVGLGTVRWTM